MIPRPDEYMRARDAKKYFEDRYARQQRDYEYTERVREGGGDDSLLFPMNVKPKHFSEEEEWQAADDIVRRFEDR